MPNYISEKGPVVDTGAQRGAAKHPSEIVTDTGNSHNMIGALGDAKILPGIIMGCETIDTDGRPFTWAGPGLVWMGCGVFVAALFPKAC